MVEGQQVSWLHLAAFLALAFEAVTPSEAQVPCQVHCKEAVLVDIRSLVDQGALHSYEGGQEGLGSPLTDPHHPLGKVVSQTYLLLWKTKQLMHQIHQKLFIFADKLHKRC